MSKQRQAIGALACAGLALGAFGYAGDARRSDAEPAAARTCSAAAGEQDIVATAVGAGQFKTLAAALEAAGLVETLKGEGPFTVFAPTDEAFAKLPKGTVEDLLKPANKKKLEAILKHHVVKGEVKAAKVVALPNAATVLGQRVDISVEESKVKVDKATVTKTDIDCTNGVIHVIDSVLMPATDDVVQTAAKAGNFKTLAAALEAAGLVEALKGEGPFTVFAPTDEAFAKLPKGALEDLLKPENKHKLADILKYHVVSGRVYADEAMKMTSAKTLQGSSFRISRGKSGWMINKANLTKTDIESSNGVIHVIDAVIMPE